MLQQDSWVSVCKVCVGSHMLVSGEKRKRLLFKLSVKVLVTPRIHHPPHYTTWQLTSASPGATVCSQELDCTGSA